MAYPSNVGCDFVVPTNKDTPLYLSTPYTRNELNSWREKATAIVIIMNSAEKSYSFKGG